MTKIDLNKLHEEMERRKNENASVFGTSIPQGGKPKDVFLHKLMTSLDRGVETESTQRIKMIENKTSERLGEKSTMNVSSNISKQPRSIVGDEDRENKLWDDIQKNKKTTLADSLESFSNHPQQLNNMQSMYPNYHHQQPNYQPQYQPQQINEGYIVGIVENAINKYIGENFNSKIEDSIKNVVFEMYASERIKEVLAENTDMIKKEVLLVLKEFSNKKKNSKK